MDVSIIFVNYNSVALLKNAIQSVIEKTKDIEYEIIVVDNNSQDNAEELLNNSFGKENINFIKLSQNIGFGRANNEGFRYAKGRNVLFLNPDTVLINNAVQILSDYLDKNPRVAVAGGNLYTENIEPTHSFSMVFPSIIWQLNLLLFGAPFKLVYFNNDQFNHKNKPLKVAYITGADMMVKHEIIKKTGGFSEDFFMYFEEAEWSYRIFKLGYDIVNIPQAKIIHLESKTFSTNQQKQKMYVDSWLIYFKKRYSSVSLSMAKLIFCIHTYIKIMYAYVTKQKDRYKVYKLFLKWINA